MPRKRRRLQVYCTCCGWQGDAKLVEETVDKKGDIYKSVYRYECPECHHELPASDTTPDDLYV